jgi:hypothetical protein
LRGLSGYRFDGRHADPEAEKTEHDMNCNHHCRASQNGAP